MQFLSSLVDSDTFHHKQFGLFSGIFSKKSEVYDGVKILTVIRYVLFCSLTHKKQILSVD